MADPLSVAGLIAGLISVGIEVTGSLSNYVDAVKGREEELRSAKQQATAMEGLLSTIKDLIPQVQSSLPASATMIGHHVKSCDTELKDLRALLSELLQPVPSGSGIRLKVAETKMKLTYPFNRSHVSRLEGRLSKVNGALQTALGVAQLNFSVTTSNETRSTSNEIRGKVNEIYGTSNEIRGTVIDMRSTSNETHGAVIDICNRSNEIHGTVINIRNMSNEMHGTVNEIRGLHDQLRDLVLSLPVLQRQSIEAGLPSSTTSATPRMIASDAIGARFDSIETTVALASKPSLLSTSIETLEKCNNSQSLRRSLFRACLCRPSRKTSYQRSRWGHFAFSYTSSSAMQHLPSCPFSRIHVETRSTEFAVEFSGLKKLCQKAAVLSFAFSHGAGGRSISPIFTCYPIVNRSTAPAFNIIKLTGPVFYDYWGWTESAKANAIQYCCNSILTLYRQGRASPKDTTLEGESLMHLLTSKIARMSTPSKLGAETILRVVANLVACGVPVTTYDRDKETPFFRLLLRYSGSGDWLDSMAELLLPAELDVPISLSPPCPFLVPDTPVAMWNPKIAEACGCGPLSLAAINGDERLVQDLVKHPQHINEVDHFGFTPLHLAIRHPSCLRTILEASGPSALENSDCGGWTAFDRACQIGQRTSAQLLLAAGSRISSRTLAWCKESCIDDVLAALKARRDELKGLALENLTSAEAESLGLHHDTVLDANAVQVQRLLLQRGIDVPSHSFIDESRHEPAYIAFGWQVNSIAAFERLWALRFRDLNSFCAQGYLPLLMHSNNVDTTVWLIEHGADYWTQFSERSNSIQLHAPITPAHFLAFELGGRLTNRLARHRPCPEDFWLMQKLMHLRVSDTCSCACFMGGCTPLKAFFDWSRDDVWVEDERRWRLPSSLELARLWAVSVQASRIDFDEEGLIVALRRSTFDALGLTHTCCDFSIHWRDYEGAPSSEEADEINSEQQPLLDLHAKLLGEFEQVAREDRSGVPLIVDDPEEFWMRRWLPRITEELDTLDGHDLTDEERAAGEAIGVIWGPRLPPEIDYEPRYGYTPERFMEEVEKIMNG